MDVIILPQIRGQEHTISQAKLGHQVIKHSTKQHLKLRSEHYLRQTAEAKTPQHMNHAGCRLITFNVRYHHDAARRCRPTCYYHNSSPSLAFSCEIVQIKKTTSQLKRTLNVSGKTFKGKQCLCWKSEMYPCCSKGAQFLSDYKYS